MRIIAGNYRGKNLFTPKTADIRPTGDKAREAIFSILNSRFIDVWEDITLLDVFAGTGAFALEAMSRGVKEVCMIDKDIALCSKNAALFPKEKERIKNIRANALSLSTSVKPYNIVFMDAPYNQGLSVKALQELEAKNWLNEDSICIVELNRDEAFELPEYFEELDNRVYGIARFIFVKKK